LRTVLDEIPQDPGSGQLRGFLEELDLLLSPGTPEIVSNTELPRVTPSGPRPPRLLTLAQTVTLDPRFQEVLQRSPLRQDSDEEIWNEVQRLFLRAPPALAEEWSQRSFQLAEQAGAFPDPEAVATLPLAREEIIYPGLRGSVQAVGLRSTPSASIAADPMRILAGVIATCLWFIDNDPHLCHCLANVFRFGIRPLVGEQHARYVDELQRRGERARATAIGIAAEATRPRWSEHFKALVDLDEALHSLVYQPVAGPESWWDRLLGQARSELFRARDLAVQAGCPVQLQVIGGMFADVSRLAPDSLQVDFGVPGEVSACLRVWTRIGGEEGKGRVLYRSPQEEA
jgi:hypothetical protein